jgi:hypothetical protein
LLDGASSLLVAENSAAGLRRRRAYCLITINQEATVRALRGGRGRPAADSAVAIHSNEMALVQQVLSGSNSRQIQESVVAAADRNASDSAIMEADFIG